MKEKAYFNWSSGKDSALALCRAAASGRYDIAALLTVANTSFGRIPMHEVGVELLKKQAASIGIPLTVVTMNPDGPPEAYQRSIQAAMDAFAARGITTALFGDIYLEALRSRREHKCRRAGMKAAFPLWGTPTRDVLYEFIEKGFKAVITSVNEAVLSRQFVGSPLDRAFVDAFPPEADPCGENGEYHSFVYDGPIFRTPVPFHLGGSYCREYPADSPGGKPSRFWYAAVE